VSVSRFLLPMEGKYSRIKSLSARRRRSYGGRPSDKGGTVFCSRGKGGGTMVLTITLSELCQVALVVISLINLIWTIRHGGQTHE
jgi:hypothetical protein